MGGVGWGVRVRWGVGAGVIEVSLSLRVSLFLPLLCDSGERVALFE